MTNDGPDLIVMTTSFPRRLTGYSTSKAEQTYFSELSRQFRVVEGKIISPTIWKYFVEQKMPCMDSGAL
jgi:hypothetical protein